MICEQQFYLDIEILGHSLFIQALFYSFLFIVYYLQFYIMEKSETRLNFLSLEIAVSLCVHKIYSCSVNMYVECVQCGSLIILLIPSFIGQVFFLFSLVMAKNNTESWVLQCHWFLCLLLFFAFGEFLRIELPCRGFDCLLTL